MCSESLQLNHALFFGKIIALEEKINIYTPALHLVTLTLSPGSSLILGSSVQGGRQQTDNPLYNLLLIIKRKNAKKEKLRQDGWEQGRP